MKRLWIAAAMAVLIAAICLIGGNTVRTSGNELIRRIEKARTLAEQGDMAGATREAKATETYWIATEQKVTLFVDHKSVDEIGAAVSRLAALAENDDPGEFLSECSQAIVTTIHMMNHEEMRFYHIF